MPECYCTSLMIRFDSHVQQSVVLMTSSLCSIAHADIKKGDVQSVATFRGAFPCIQYSNVWENKYFEKKNKICVSFFVPYTKLNKNLQLNLI